MNKIQNVNSSVAPEVPKTVNEDLRLLFTNLITARDEFSAEFNLLFTERLKIYQTFISLAYIHIFNSRIQELIIEFKYYFELLTIVNTSQFKDALSELFKIYSTATNQNSEDSLNLYFTNVFNGLKDMIYPNIDVVFNPNTVTMTITKAIDDIVVITKDNIDGGNIDDSNETIFNFTDKILFILLVLKDKNENFKDFIQGKASFLREVFSFQVNIELERSLKKIESYIVSYNVIDLYLKEKDTNYSDEYIISIKNNFTQLEELIGVINDFSVEGLNLLIQTGQIASLYNTIADLNLKAQDIIFDAIQSLKLIETVIEDYSPFIKMPTDESIKLQKSMDFIDGMKQYFNTITTTTIVNPFVVDNYLEEIEFKNWKDSLLETNFINPDIFNMVILRVGIFLSRETFSKVSGEELVTFSLLRMIDKRLILETVISEEFKDIKYIEEENLSKGIQVKPRFQDDIISFPFKQIFPSLEVLDYMSFDEVNSTDNEIINDFKENIIVLILEGFLKNKSEIDLSINKIIDILRTFNFNNLKSLYVKMCFYNVIHRLISYLQTNISSSNISESTLRNMKTLIAEADINDNEDYQILNESIEDYLEIWNYFYNSDDDTLFIDSVITDEGLQNLLK